MNILFISEYYPPKSMGGGEINLSLTAQALAEEGHAVSVLTSSFLGLPAEEKSRGAHIYRRLRTGKSANTFFGNMARAFFFTGSVERETKKLVSKHAPEVLHLQGASVLAAPSLQKLGLPLFATIESYTSLCPKGDRLYRGREPCQKRCSLGIFLSCQKKSLEIGKMKNRWYLKYNPLFLAYLYWRYSRMQRALRCCHLVPISGYVQHLLQQQGLESCEPVPNIIVKEEVVRGKEVSNKQKTEGGVQTAESIYRNQPTAISQMPSSQKPRVLYLGALITAKGPQLLLEALQGLPYRCDLYGEGMLKEELQRFIKEHHLDAEIHSPVAYETVPSLYQQAAVVVFPSLWPEPFGRIPLEALAAGKKVIAFSVGAIPEVVGEKALLVKPGDVEGLRKALLQAGEEVVKENKRKLRSAEEILAPFGKKEVARKLLQVYTKCSKYSNHF